MWLFSDQIGRFSKALGPRITYKSSPNIWRLFSLPILKDYFNYFKVKTAVTTLLGNILNKIGLLYNLTSGHTMLG